MSRPRKPAPPTTGPGSPDSKGRTRPLAVRLEGDRIVLLDRLRTHFGLGDRAAVIRLALQRLALSEGLVSAG